MVQLSLRRIHADLLIEIMHAPLLESPAHLAGGNHIMLNDGTEVPLTDPILTPSTDANRYVHDLRFILPHEQDRLITLPSDHTEAANPVTSLGYASQT